MANNHKCAGDCRVNAMTPQEIAREHISYIRRNGHSPARFYRDMQLLPPAPVPTWDDVRDEIVRIYRQNADL